MNIHSNLLLLEYFECGPDDSTGFTKNMTWQIRITTTVRACQKLLPPTMDSLAAARDPKVINVIELFSAY